MNFHPLFHLICLLLLNGCMYNPIVRNILWQDVNAENLNLFSLIATIQANSTGGSVLESSGSSAEDSASALEYGASNFLFTKGVSIAIQTPVYTDALTECTSTPNLPNGLSLDASTCAISGVPSLIQGTTSYNITAKGTSGNLSANISIAVRGLNSYRFESNSTRAWTSGTCGVTDQSSGVGPYTFNVDATNDDVLITVNTNLYITNFVCDSANQSEVSLYIDGAKKHTFTYNRCWGQLAPMTTAFIFPSMSKGDHTIELKFCGNGTRIPAIDGAYPTILTTTSLQSNQYFEGKDSFVLPIGTTPLTNNTSTWVPIVNGSNVSSSYTAKSNVLLWQSLALGGLDDAGVNLRLDPLTTEDWTEAGDGPYPMSTFTYSSLSASYSSTIIAKYNTSFLPSIIGKSTYDNTLNTLAFKTPTTGSYGKSVISSLVQESAGTFITLMSLPITNSNNTRCLINFATNYALNPSGGGCGCEFKLLVNGNQKALTMLTSSAAGLTRESSLISIETVPSGNSIPVEIQYRRTLCGTCDVHRATFTVIPLE